MRTISAASLLVAVLAASPVTKADGEERLHLAGGASAASSGALFGDDGRYQFKSEHVIEGEAGYAHLFGPHFELGAAYAFGALGDPGVKVHRIMPLSVRLFATPADGVEVGLGLRGGLLLGRWSSPRPAYADSVSFVGGVGGARIDGRFWLRDHPHFGVVVAAESWLALASGDPQRFLMASLATFTVGVAYRL